jgi:hypothetical protein
MNFVDFLIVPLSIQKLLLSHFWMDKHEIFVRPIERLRSV